MLQASAVAFSFALPTPCWAVMSVLIASHNRANGQRWCGC
jgi:uncharacterized membrane protein YccC